MKNTKILMTEFNNNKYNTLLEDIYIDKGMTQYQIKRYVEALKKYEAIFGEAEVSLFSAPGRSEVCGNHTDHQHGKVLAASVNLDSIAVAAYNDDNVVRLVSEGYHMITVNLDDLSVNKGEEGTSLSLVKGVIDGLLKRGYKAGGFNAYTTSNVIVGAGLSSSASFEVIIGTIISGMYNDMKIDSVEIAQVSQYAENVYFNKPCGLMDQMACAVGGMINIDFHNPENPVVKKVAVDFEKNNFSLCIVDTKGSHADLTDDYAMIPIEMKKVANFFGKEYLRDVEVKDFYSNIAKIRETSGDRAVLRAIHFFEEEVNVDNAVDALETENFRKFLDIIEKSGNSSYKYLQNVYTSKNVQEQNLSIALSVSDVVMGDNGVCRVHGGGFAGTIQAFVKNDFVTEYKKAIENIFGENSCYVLKVRKYGGIKVI